MEFRGATGWLQPPTTRLALSAHGYSGKGKHYPAPYRGAKDAGRLEDAHHKLADHLVPDRRISGTRYDVVVIDAAIFIHISLDDDGRIVIRLNGLRADSGVEIMRYSHSAQRLVIRHDWLRRGEHAQ